MSRDGDWCYFNNQLGFVANGNGMSGLKNALPDADCGFAVFRISGENVGNTGAGIKTEANVILQYKGPNAKAMAKNKNNGALQKALDSLKPNKGFIEVLTRGSELTPENIFDRWRPGSGSKVIDD